MKKVVIDLGERFGRGQTFTIEAHNASRVNKYVQSAVLNGNQLQRLSVFRLPELLKGGTLTLKWDRHRIIPGGIER